MELSEARAVLGVGPDATIADAKAAHRRLIKLLHPDRVSDLDGEQQATATEATARLNLALETLRADDAESRLRDHQGFDQRPGSGTGTEETPRQESPPPPTRTTPPAAPGATPEAPAPAADREPKGQRRWLFGAAVAALAAVAGGAYLVSHQAPPPKPAAAPTGNVGGTLGIEVAPPSDATGPAGAPSPVAKPTHKSTPTASTAKPKPRNWVPAGFEKWDDQVAYRWDVDFTCPTDTPQGCWGVTVVNRDGCPHQQYLSLEILDSAGQVAGTTFELKGGQPAGAKTRYVLPDTTFGNVGEQARVDSLICS